MKSAPSTTTGEAPIMTTAREASPVQSLEESATKMPIEIMGGHVRRMSHSYLTRDPENELASLGEISALLNPVTVTPKRIYLASRGGTISLHMQNNCQVRYSFKVLVTNYNCYAVNPVHGFVEARATAQLMLERLSGPKSEDMLEVRFLPVDAAARDPKAAFAGGVAGEFSQEVPISAE